MRRVLRRLFLLCLLLAAGIGWDYARFLHTPLAQPAAAPPFVIPPGASLRHIARTLYVGGWFHQPWHSGYFLLLARSQGVARMLHAGEYRLEAGLTPVALLHKLTEGAVIQHSVTLLEGWRFEQVRATLAQHPALRQTLTHLDADTIMAQLGLPCVHPEGQFFPDTYFFLRDTTDLELLRRAQTALSRTLAQVWHERDPELPLAGADELLTLASLVEKETGCAQERADVAGVFIRRLRREMRLQSDPTVIYALGSRFDGDLRRADLQRDSAYNTYLYTGLPPAPIALVGRAALVASAHPTDSDALYFVAKGDGCHEFSATLAAHNAAVRRYQKP